MGRVDTKRPTDHYTHPWVFCSARSAKGTPQLLARSMKPQSALSDSGLSARFHPLTA